MVWGVVFGRWPCMASHFKVYFTCNINFKLSLWDPHPKLHFSMCSSLFSTLFVISNTTIANPFSINPLAITHDFLIFNINQTFLLLSNLLLNIPHIPGPLNMESKLFSICSPNIDDLQIRELENQMKNIPIWNPIVPDKRIVPCQFFVPTNQFLFLHNKPFTILGPKFHNLNWNRPHYTHWNIWTRKC